MKIRKGFVSNSSSSSFTCSVCNYTEAGMDMGLEDAGMFECTEGHTFCEGHQEGIDLEAAYATVEAKREFCLKHAWGDDAQEQIKNADEDELEEIFEDYWADYADDDRYSVNPSLCPCCTLKSPSDSQLLAFVIWNSGLTKKEALEIFQNDFSSWQKFLEVSKA